MVRSIAGIVLAIVLTVTVGAGAPLHLVQAHSNTSPAGHDCAICKTLSHSMGDLCGQSAPVSCDPNPTPSSFPEAVFSTDGCPAPRTPRAPPALLA